MNHIQSNSTLAAAFVFAQSDMKKNVKCFVTVQLSLPSFEEKLIQTQLIKMVKQEHQDICISTNNNDIVTFQE